MDERDVPPGWDANPSSWSHRLPLVGLSLVGFAIAGYLALYQLGVVRSVWEPFFGTGSRTVLHSPVARALPLPDAALGALGYLVDAATGALGGRARWRTAPWIVVAFGLVVGLLGAVAVVLAILQPVAFHAWCTLCLCSAAVSVLLVGPAAREVLASAQFLARERARGRSLWNALWHGDDESRDERGGGLHAHGGGAAAAGST